MINVDDICMILIVFFILNIINISVINKLIIYNNIEIK